MSRVSILEWLTVPAIFLYANIVEYWGHRVPVRRPTANRNKVEWHGHGNLIAAPFHGG
jgi:hypothetical protein